MSLQVSGTNSYEIWVRTLRAWAADPRVSLADLPVLQDDTFSPGTMMRLIEHINKGLEAAGQRWVDALGRAMGSITDADSLARELVQLRPVLARRVQLATHPSLPPTLRTAYTKNVGEWIERQQSEFEQMLARLFTSGVDAVTVDRLVAAAKQNPFRAVLGYEVVQDGSRIESQAIPLSVRVEGDNQPSGASRVRSRLRRVDPLPTSVERNS